jgi:membrane-bound lytic murein transglycosylase D
MAMIESKFLIDARSNKKAAGLWQIIPPTAKILKLKIDKNIDERLDPIKSTKAALSYLSYLHKRFGKWYLAAMAYNCGESRLSKGIKESGSDDIEILMSEDRRFIPKETKSYIIRLLKAALISHLKPIQKAISESGKDDCLELVKLNDTLFMHELSKKYHISKKSLKEFNHHIKCDLITPKQNIYLPSKKAKKSKKERKKIRYKIESGDTLLKIAKKFNIKVETLTKLNPGLTIILPIGDEIFIYDNRDINRSKQ